MILQSHALVVALLHADSSRMQMHQFLCQVLVRPLVSLDWLVKCMTICLCKFPARTVSFCSLLLCGASRDCCVIAQSYTSPRLL
jgi:hypothetical protein